MRRLSESILKENPTNRTILLQVYGDYLSHGGTHEDFMRLTDDEIQIMYTVSQSERAHMMNTIIKAIAKMFGAKE